MHTLLQSQAEVAPQFAPRIEYPSLRDVLTCVITSKLSLFLAASVFLFHPDRFSALYPEHFDLQRLAKFNAKLLDECEVDLGGLRWFKPKTSAGGSSNHTAFAEYHNVGEGGRWTPVRCSPADRTVVIVPYRDRPGQLEAFLRHMHPFLQAQQVPYQIYVVEQRKPRAFNRGKLFNVGYAEAVSNANEGNMDEACLVLHDVDLLPLDARNLYTCGEQPKHLSVSVDVFRFNLMYEDLFGGAVALRSKVFQSVNGFSNEFYGECFQTAAAHHDW